MGARLENYHGIAGWRCACRLQTVCVMGRLKAGHPAGVFKTRFQVKWANRD
jgi:hypothetical protein